MDYDAFIVIVAESGRKGRRSPWVIRTRFKPGCGKRAGRRGTGRPNVSCKTKFSGANGGQGIYSCSFS